MPASRLTYFEGLPGLGKTTTAVTLASRAERAVLVAENNPAPADHETVADLDPMDAARWYLHGEIVRTHYAARCAAPGQHASVICDKGSLATLAFLYALSRTGGVTDAAYRHVRHEYLVHLRPRLPVHARTIVFAGPVALSLSRRAAKPDRADRPLWYAEPFLDAFYRFYLAEAPSLRHGPLALLDASGDPAATMRRAAALTGSPLPVATADGPRGSEPARPVPVDELSPPFRSYAVWAGATVLGQALGAPFHQHGGLAQPFERHLLLHRHGKVMLQRDLWTPPTVTLYPPRSTTAHTRPGGST